MELSREHGWLERFVGEWTFEFEASAGPGEPPSREMGTESTRSLGGAWVVMEARSGETSDTSIMTLGFDSLRGLYVGTFVSSMMTHLWLYEGTVDATGRMLILQTEGPSYADETKLAKYRDVTTFESEDHRIMTSSHQNEDGEWVTFMTAHYRRRIQASPA